MIEFDFPGLPANEDKILNISIDPDTKEKKVLGCGTFGAVFLGELTITGKPTVLVAVKVHHPCYEQRQALIDEYKFLKLLGGKFNVIELLTYIYDSERKILHFVYPFFEETPFLSLVVDATEDEVKSYMLNILTALAWLHSSNIMHKDVKYNNFLYNRIMKTGKLIDLGCACYMNELIEGCTRDPNSSGDYVSGPSLFYSSSSVVQYNRKTSMASAGIGFKLPHQRLNGTRGFKSLETLITSDLISSAVDIFATGCILALLLLRKKQFFIQDTSGDGIMEMCKLYGSHRVSQVALDLGKTITIKIEDYFMECKMKTLSRIPERQIFERLANLPVAASNCQEKFSISAFQFLSKLLSLTPSDRFTAEEALEHNFLKKIN